MGLLSEQAVVPDLEQGVQEFAQLFTNKVEQMVEAKQRNVDAEAAGGRNAGLPMNK
jgi:t-SNARE complex subunit (syntaxin)